MPAHLLHAPGAEAHDQRPSASRSMRLRSDETPNPRHPPPPPARSAAPRRSAPPGTRRTTAPHIPPDRKVLSPRKAAIEQVDRGNPVQPPQPHLRQPVDMRHQPAAPAIQKSIRTQHACRRLLRVGAGVAHHHQLHARIARRSVGSTPAAITGRGPGRIAIPSASISAAMSGSARRSASGRIIARNVVEASRSSAARSASPCTSHSRADDLDRCHRLGARRRRRPTRALPGSRQRRTRPSSSQHSICGNIAQRANRAAVRRCGGPPPAPPPSRPASSRCASPRGGARGGTGSRPDRSAWRGVVPHAVAAAH